MEIIKEGKQMKPKQERDEKNQKTPLSNVNSDKRKDLHS